MLDFINTNWQLLTLLTGIIAYICRQTISMRKGICALLRTDLVRLYDTYSKLGYCPLNIRQCVSEEYSIYHSMKGNGFGTNIYNYMMSLPPEPQNEGLQK